VEVAGHEPVLADAVVQLVAPALEGGGIVVDATLGRAGHARRLLEAAPRAGLVGIDRDPDAVEASRTRLAPYLARVWLVRDDFANLPSVLERLGIASVRGVLFDLGVSSPQLADARRGFGFRSNGPLDMRMDPTQELTAADVVNRYEENHLAAVIRNYGEERFASRIARALVAARPVEGTGTLAEIIRDAIPAPARRRGAHPARRTFQAIRIEVNRELEALQRVLPLAIDALEPGGRLAVISYHSLEDRLVKRALANESRGCVCPADFPVCRCGAEARVRVLTRRPIRAGSDELRANPPAKAAKLRAGERIGTEELPVDHAARESA
jgi:16S rRNA (cytosine1402-N4)-methyltransferase